MDKRRACFGGIRVGDVAVFRDRQKIAQLQTGQDRNYIAHRSARISGEIVHDVVVSCPLPIDCDLPQHVFGDSAHRSDLIDFLFSDLGIVYYRLTDNAIRVANQNITGFAVAFHREFYAIFHAHLEDSADGGDSFRVYIVFLNLKLADDLVNDRLALFRCLLVKLFNVFERQP